MNGESRAERFTRWQRTPEGREAERQYHAEIKAARARFAETVRPVAREAERALAEETDEALAAFYRALDEWSTA